ncbi:MAG TPA: glycosyltransferase family 4 protein, partial [Jatrophihabitantaceae bacterium]|nr:glycosyltransferase family 4 protein [Jatrophihabitantaceae bacterium]
LPDDLDVLVGQQICTADRTAIWHSLAADEHRSTALVYENDDDLWSIHPSNLAAAIFREPEIQAAVEAAVRVADAVTVTTEYLADHVRTMNSNVHVLPNCIDATLLQHERPRSDRVTIGWAGGSSHNPDFEFVRKELGSFLRRNLAVDVHFIGMDYRKAVGRPDGRHSGWNDNLVEYLTKIDFDIGIAPLAYHAFNKGKSDLKALEYAALGIPIVAADYGPYTDSVQHGVTGFLVRRPHEWARYLRDLVNDEAMRLEMGENARRWAATRTIQGNVWRWEAVYRSVVDSLASSGGVRTANSAVSVAI